MSWISLLLPLIFLFTVAFSEDVLVTVSQLRGDDHASCLPGDVGRPIRKPCRTLEYAYHQSIKRLNSFTSALEIALIDEKHDLYEPLVLNEKNVLLDRLVFQGLRKSPRHCTHLVSKTGTTGIFVGGRSLDEPHAITYSVHFRNLCWTNFTACKPACLTCFRVQGIVLYANQFFQNNCSAVNVVDTQINITDSVFIESNAESNFNISNLARDASNFTTFPASNYSAGGAVALVFLDRHNESHFIKNCTFSRNSAVAKSLYSQDNRYIDLNNTAFQFERIGGGVALAFAGNTSSNKVYVEDCIFTHNLAFSGGGIGIVAQNEAKYNKIYITQCRFGRNVATTSAGALLFAALVHSDRNVLVVEDCLLRKNRAGDGGAMKVFYHSVRHGYHQRMIPCSQVTIIKRTTICGNSAKVASAIHLLYIMPTALKPIIPVRFENCTICHHSPVEVIHRGPTPYTGALLSNRVDIEFTGKNSIYNNEIESAVYISNSVMNISGELKFKNNAAASSGGALSIRDVSYIYLAPGTQLLFSNNYAKFQGGAIFVQALGLPELVYPYNPSCFLQYTVRNVPASKWKVKVTFEANVAGFKGAAVFASTISSCSWKDTPPYVDFSSVLRWSNNFVYRNNYLVVSIKSMDFMSWAQDAGRGGMGDINTDTSSFNISYKRPLYVSPGEEVLFNLSGYDELQNSVYSVAVATDFGGNASEAGEDELYLADRYYAIPPHPQKPEKLSYSATLSEYRKIQKYSGEKHVIQFVDSASAFISNINLSIIPIPCRPGLKFDQNEGLCICDSQIPGVLRCADNIIYLEQGTWANVTSERELTTYFCPDQYCGCPRPRKTRMFTGCPFDPIHPDKQCASGRQGILCGHCQPGYGLSLFTHQCKKCDGRSAPIVTFILFVVFFFILAIVVVMVNPGFSSYLRGPIFFCQVLPYLFQPYDQVGQVVQTATLLIDLGGPASLPFDGCIQEDFSSLDSILLSYIFPAIICTVLFAAYVLHKLRVLNFRRNSPFEGFWILIVAMYKFLAETSLLLFFCVPMEDSHVFFYDGSITCFSGKHLIGAIVAVVVISVVVVPPPFLVFLVAHGYLRVQPQVADALTNGLRKSFRWWWAVDLTRRLVFVAFYVFIPDWDDKQVALTLTSLVVFTLHAQCKPYEASLANLGETCLLFALTLISLLQIVQNNSFRVVLSAITVVSSAVYIVAVSSYVFFNFLRGRCHQKGYNSVQDPDESLRPRSRSRASERITPDAICVQCSHRDCTRHEYTPYSSG